MSFLYILLLIIVIALIGYYVFWKYYFLRDPERKSPAGKNIIASADGTVLEILRVTEDKELTVYKKHMGKIKTICSDVATDTYLVSIFMSPMDVHINRMPTDAKVENIVYEPGKFLAVNSLDAGLQNEKCELLLKTSFGKMKIIQVAGLLARRIICRAKVGDSFKKGERYGLINLGSQMIMIMPSKVKIKVKKGQHIRAGETIIATH